MLKTRAARGVFGAAIAVAAAVAPAMTTAPANASSKNIGTGDGHESRCASHGYDLCLYYYHGMTTGAYWGTISDDPNLYDDYFFSGTGTGSDQVVKNNATAMSCSYRTYKCISYYNSGYSGSYDWEYGGHHGELYYTWNNNASQDVMY